MHPFSVLTLAIFVAGYITARWDLVTRLYELTVFAWDKGVIVSRAIAVPLPRRSVPSLLPPETTLMQKNMMLTLQMQLRAAQGLAFLTLVFLAIFIPVQHIARKEADLVLLPSAASNSLFCALSHLYIR
jgi:phosphatidylinositol N-acetylglucosaminyltransferase subunit Q